MLPFWIVLGVVGPIISLIALAWVWHFLRKPRARIETDQPEGYPAPLGADGLPAFPPNVPYCLEHAHHLPLDPRPVRDRRHRPERPLPGRWHRPGRGHPDLLRLRHPLRARRREHLRAWSCATRARQRVAPRSPEAARHDTPTGMTLAKVSLYLFSIGAIGLVIAFVLDVVHTTQLAVGRRRATVSASGRPGAGRCARGRRLVGSP